ncbi:MAG TPA: histidine kinase [Flavisolibacter sp.]|nr:histidine kinase [Flavisolibacter sp.]
MTKWNDILIRVIAITLTCFVYVYTNDEWDNLITGKDIGYPLFSIVSITLWWELSRLLILKIYERLLPAAPMAKRIAWVFFASLFAFVLVRSISNYLKAVTLHLPIPHVGNLVVMNCFYGLMSVWKIVATFEIFYVSKFIYKMEQEKQELLQANLQRQLDSLRDQVSPHFLFNNLNVLSTLITKDPDKADEFVEELSNVYRYLLRNSEDNLTPLNEELKFIESYNHLLKTRFGDGYQPEINVDRELKQYKLPPMTLQLLVENAVKHNVVSRDQPLRLQLYTKDHELVITNNLQPRIKTMHSAGVGLENIRSKYKLLNQADIKINKTEKDFTITLPLVKQS